MNIEATLDVFVNNGMLDKSVAKEVAEEQSTNGKELWETLIDFGIIGAPEDFWSIIANELGAQYISLANFTPPADVLAMLPAHQARLHGALPVEYRDGEGLYVCLEDPLNPQTIDDLRLATGKDVYMHVAPDYEVRARIAECYGGSDAVMTDLLDELSNMDVTSKDGADEVNAAPVIKFVNLVITQAIKEKASDIHLEPFEKEFKIRYRVDGALYEMAPPPIHLANPVISRVKVMAGMNIAERRVPQDGRIVMKVGENRVDMRVNSCPPSTENPWCSVCWTATTLCWTSASSTSHRTSTSTFWTPWPSPTASSWSPAPPVPVRPPRSTPPCERSTPSIPSSSPLRTPWNTISTVSCRCPSTSRSASPSPRAACLPASGPGPHPGGRNP